MKISVTAVVLVQRKYNYFNDELKHTAKVLAEFYAQFLRYLGSKFKYMTIPLPYTFPLPIPFD